MAAAETIAGFNEDKASQFVEATLKSIIHPGEVSEAFALSNADTDSASQVYVVATFRMSAIP